ncbi:MAG TPA: SRPBCC family protein [Gammaproteobacteria bacterium]|nr:SRPBCC family protein [Gammaproteobacteria bacterium]
MKIPSRLLPVLLATSLLVYLPVPRAADAAATGFVARYSHVSASFLVHQPPGRVFPLFDPLHEAEWSPGFAITPLHPVPFAVGKDAVFTTVGHGGTTTWVINDYSPAAGSIEYVLMRPGYQLKRIRIECTPTGSGDTRVNVSYTVTGLGDAGNQHVTDYDAEFIHHWDTAVNAYFDKTTDTGDKHP